MNFSLWFQKKTIILVCCLCIGYMNVLSSGYINALCKISLHLNIATFKWMYKSLMKWKYECIKQKILFIWILPLSTVEHTLQMEDQRVRSMVRLDSPSSNSLHLKDMLLWGDFKLHFRSMWFLYWSWWLRFFCSIKMVQGKGFFSLCF